MGSSKGLPLMGASTEGGEVGHMATVRLQEGESQEQLLKRFQKKVQGDGILTAYRRRRFFVSESELRRKAMRKAIRKARIKQARQKQKESGRRGRYR